MIGRGKYVRSLNKWIQCPECNSENTAANKGWEGEWQIKCHECGAWSSIT